MASFDKKKILQEEHLYKVFEQFDANGDGAVSKKEVGQLFGQGVIPENVIEQMIRESSRDGGEMVCSIC